jgi:hypothetical protein
VSTQYKAALVRAVIAGVVAAGSAFFASIASAGAGSAAIAAGGSFFGVLVARGLGEGTYDTNRDRPTTRRRRPATAAAHQ